MLFGTITACAGVSRCVAVAANLWLCLAVKDSLPLATLVSCGVLLPGFSQIGAACLVVPALVTISASYGSIVTHVFTLPLGGSSLASDYIIASFGSAVNHYLSFNKRGATAFQVLLPRQLFTYFALLSTSSLLLLLVFRIVIEYPYLCCFTPYIVSLYNKARLYFLFLAFFSHRSSVQIGAAAPMGKT